MTRPLDRHLNSDELDALITPQDPGISVAGQTSEEAFREAQRHVESCQDCDRKVQMHRSAQRAISSWSGDTASRGPKCSDNTEWVKVAAGLLEENQTRERLTHAAECGHCGPLLSAAAKLISDETTPDEEAVLAGLGSAQLNWQVRMARTLTGRPETARMERASFWVTLLRWPRPVFAGAAALLVLTLGWMAIPVLEAKYADRLLAESYTERRTLQLRFTGAKFAPMRVERSDGSAKARPPSLSRAESLISQRLRQSPTDLVWLQEKARADLLESNYESAIATLESLRGTKVEPSTLLCDLASAYYERGVSLDSSADFDKASQLLGKAIEVSPTDALLFFNRALVLEKMHRYDQAIADWNRYLSIEGTGPWAVEARTHLNRVRQKSDSAQAD